MLRWKRGSGTHCRFLHQDFPHPRSSGGSCLWRVPLVAKNWTPLRVLARGLASSKGRSSEWRNGRTGRGPGKGGPAGARARACIQSLFLFAHKSGYAKQNMSMRPKPPSACNKMDTSKTTGLHPKAASCKERQVKSDAGRAQKS